MRNVIDVLLVEDDTLLRASLASALAGGGLTVVGSVATAAEATAVAARRSIDVLLTDLDLGAGPNGIVLAHALRREHVDLGVVVLTSYTDPRLVGTKLSQLPPGALYVRKQDVSDLTALRAALMRAAARGASEGHRSIVSRRRGPNLTDTQIETMGLIAEGLTNAGIAERRVVSEKSVEVTISRILREIGPDPGGAANPRVRILRAYYALAGADVPGRRTP
jgi:DNA-binding NarL/FixJ family response regulator